MTKTFSRRHFFEKAPVEPIIKLKERGVTVKKAFVNIDYFARGVNNAKHVFL